MWLQSKNFQRLQMMTSGMSYINQSQMKKTQQKKINKE